MADIPPDAASAPTPTPPNGQTQPQREVVINAQYIKDLSFENPRAPQSLLQQQQQPEVQVGIDVKAQAVAPGFFEVIITIHAEAKGGGERIFLVELAYGAVVSLNNVPEADMAGALLVEAPRLMFPFARAIIANATRDGGFLPLTLQPIDFAQLLRQQQAQAQAAAAAAAASGTATA
ncbi:MAG TPA: protein-export chaperone SecB [Stellaceae bacterium]|nr:protein-export chaperone SecB [Stellaceae bacterium]